MFNDLKLDRSEFSKSSTLVDNEIDLLTDNNSIFHPKFTHQVFHRDETIKGMKDLNVTIYLTPTTLRPYVYWSCSDQG